MCYLYLHWHWSSLALSITEGWSCLWFMYCLNERRTTRQWRYALLGTFEYTKTLCIFYNFVSMRHCCGFPRPTVISVAVALKCIVTAAVVVNSCRMQGLYVLLSHLLSSIDLCLLPCVLVKGELMLQAVEFCFVSFYVLVFCSCVCLAETYLRASPCLFPAWKCGTVACACEGSWRAPPLKAAPPCALVDNTGKWWVAVYHCSFWSMIDSSLALDSFIITRGLGH